MLRIRINCLVKILFNYKHNIAFNTKNCFKVFYSILIWDKYEQILNKLLPYL